MKKIILLTCLGFILSGCSVHLQFNDRLSYQSLKQIKSEIHLPQKQNLNIVWVPDSFTSRIDIQGSSGFIGGGSRTRIPTGIGLSTRIEEAISTYADINSGGKKLTIIVNNAKTKFTYGMTNIDNASVYLNLTFELSGKTWTKEFSTKQNDSGVKDANMTSVVEYAWDQIALDVAREVAKHL
ncbi:MULTISPECIES: hypothetical protein [unclassified Gilliamella]|uniref:hypothetical protein n=1 Tax=unclassified Gilliamella TaxID=2685620 RepID=UPI00226A8981|nr:MULTISPECIES: hypothetical protein [unclassified Gilliamella]MCX8641346.1 hypothetical protein [Gilliamella sp. B3835]MCX8707456.1 hypothetical protein [Gilliamella sp. B3783]MCX8710536.1 hypothetical protein [Gilliamella sp. B3780]MCX8714651.1 hypothetical protein [Gilliamella sp. B3781]MCX8716537.1 hypothetical protein [Gilliamella sp. B3784]